MEAELLAQTHKDNNVYHHENEELFWTDVDLAAEVDAIKGKAACERTDIPLFSKASNIKKNEIVVVKFGGSALTNKDKFESLRDVTLNRVSEQIKQLLAENHLIILIHGAGSFGHFTAKSYGLSKGGEESSWIDGVSLTRRSVTKLNGLVLDALLSAAIPAVSVELFPTMIVSDSKGDILRQEGAISSASNLLKIGFLPVLHGDVVLNDRNRCRIFSGDKIMKWFCNSMHSNSDSDNNDGFKVVAAVFLTDVAGVFSHPPDHASAVLIRQIVIDCDDSSESPSMSCYTQYSDHNLAKENSSSGSSGQEIQILTSKLVHDVTGGIAGKLQAAVDIARLGIPVYIVEAGTDHALQAMRGIRPDKCTVISKRLY
eukprot:gene28501-37626_t